MINFIRTLFILSIGVLESVETKIFINILENSNLNSSHQNYFIISFSSCTFTYNSQKKQDTAKSLGAIYEWV